MRVSPLLSRSIAVAAFSAALTLSSCSKLNDMQDTTHHMSDTTDHLASSTDALSKKTDHLSDTSDHLSEKTDHLSDTSDELKQLTTDVKTTSCIMYASLRQADAKLSRNNDMLVIRDGKNIDEKLGRALAFNEGFEYQIWSPECSQYGSREDAMADAALEILAGIQAFDPDRSDVKGTHAAGTAHIMGNADNETIYALAATLHYTNSKQAKLLVGSEEKLMTPEDIIVQGLRIEKLKDEGKLTVPEPAWAAVVGKYEKNAEFLLRVRANFLMAYAYAVAAGDDFGNDPSKSEEAWMMMWKQSAVGNFFSWAGQSSKWTPNLTHRKPSEIAQRITRSLNLSVATRNSLMSLGINPMTQRKLLRVWANADLSGFTAGKISKDIKNAALITQQAETLTGSIKALETIAPDQTL